MQINLIQKSILTYQTGHIGIGIIRRQGFLDVLYVASMDAFEKVSIMVATHRAIYCGYITFQNIFFLEILQYM